MKKFLPQVNLSKAYHKLKEGNTALLLDGTQEDFNFHKEYHPQRLLELNLPKDETVGWYLTFPLRHVGVIITPPDVAPLYTMSLSNTIILKDILPIRFRETQDDIHWNEYLKWYTQSIIAKEWL